MVGWNADTAAGPLGSGAVTLVEGSSFCISSANGDIYPSLPHGVFVRDTRILSRWNLTINGQSLEPLAAETKEPYRALFVGRVPRTDGYADSTLIVERLREVGVGLLERITVRNYSLNPVECVISLNAEADFADVFEVKEARIERQWEEIRQPGGDSLTIRATWEDVRKGVVITAAGAQIGAETLTYRTVVAPQTHWETALTVVPTLDGPGPVRPFMHLDVGGLSPRDRRRQEWVAKIPKVQMGNHSVERTLQRKRATLRLLSGVKPWVVFTRVQCGPPEGRRCTPYRSLPCPTDTK